MTPDQLPTGVAQNMCYPNTNRYTLTKNISDKKGPSLIMTINPDQKGDYLFCEKNLLLPQGIMHIESISSDNCTEMCIEEIQKKFEQMPNLQNHNVISQILPKKSSYEEKKIGKIS